MLLNLEGQSTAYALLYFGVPLTERELCLILFENKSEKSFPITIFSLLSCNFLKFTG